MAHQFFLAHQVDRTIKCQCHREWSFQVRWRRAEHVLQLSGSACGTRLRQSTCDHPWQSSHQHHPQDIQQGASQRGQWFCRSQLDFQLTNCFDVKDKRTNSRCNCWFRILFGPTQNIYLYRCRSSRRFWSHVACWRATACSSTCRWSRKRSSPCWLALVSVSYTHLTLPTNREV